MSAVRLVCGRTARTPADAERARQRSRIDTIGTIDALAPAPKELS
jgi:hypothetical protein